MIRTIFICNYLADEELRREIHEGLNVVENWNSANKDIFYGKAGDLTGDDREHVEVSALALHLIQATIAYLNTHLIQIILRDDPSWRSRLTPEDMRGLSALFWTHLNLYGPGTRDTARSWRSSRRARATTGGCTRPCASGPRTWTTIGGICHAPAWTG